MNSPLLDKSLEFSTQIVLFYEVFSKSKKDTTIATQLLRSATSIGANINEAVYGNSKADFISKLHISFKESGESIYWLTLLKRTNLTGYDFESLLVLTEEIKRMLIASLNTAKENKRTPYVSQFYKRITSFLYPIDIKNRHLENVTVRGRLPCNGGLPYFCASFYLSGAFMIIYTINGALKSKSLFLIACDRKMCYTCVRKLIGKLELNGGYYGI